MRTVAASRFHVGAPAKPGPLREHRPLIADYAIGLAVPAEARRIAELSRDAIEDGLAWRWTPPRVLRSIQDRSTNVAVAREDGRLIGFAIMHYGEREAHVLLLAVQASRRRAGIGSALLSWLEVTARTAGIGWIRLEARSRNTVARAFYRKHGFKEIGLLAGWYEGVEDGVRLIKPLGFQA